jgi:hypothetical protein
MSIEAVTLGFSILASTHVEATPIAPYPPPATSYTQETTTSDGVFAIRISPDGGARDLVQNPGAGAVAIPDSSEVVQYVVHDGAVWWLAQSTHREDGQYMYDSSLCRYELGASEDVLAAGTDIGPARASDSAVCTAVEGTADALTSGDAGTFITTYLAETRTYRLVNVSFSNGDLGLNTEFNTGETLVLRDGVVFKVQSSRETGRLFNAYRSLEYLTPSALQVSTLNNGHASLSWSLTHSVYALSRLVAVTQDPQIQADLETVRANVIATAVNNRWPAWKYSADGSSDDPVWRPWIVLDAVIYSALLESCIAATGPSCDTLVSMAQDFYAQAEPQWMEARRRDSWLSSYYYRCDQQYPFAGDILPFNQSNAVGRMLLSLAELTGSSDYDARIETLFENWHGQLAPAPLHPDETIWKYWPEQFYRGEDRPGDCQYLYPDDRRPVYSAAAGEDTGHGSINYEFASDAAEHLGRSTDVDAAAILGIVNTQGADFGRFMGGKANDYAQPEWRMFNGWVVEPAVAQIYNAWIPAGGLLGADQQLYGTYAWSLSDLSALNGWVEVEQLALSDVASRDFSFVAKVAGSSGPSLTLWIGDDAPVQSSDIVGSMRQMVGYLNP